ncbi:MAG: hypothetical protein RBS85_00900 [Methanofastidiosum sp.]|jgi:hypothetical protein|nr:hypothetical protein [Methanofastidiosum sp.]
MNSAAEFLAGKKNYENYKSFLKENGIFGLLKKERFEIEKTV